VDLSSVRRADRNISSALLAPWHDIQPESPGSISRPFMSLICILYLIPTWKPICQEASCTSEINCLLSNLVYFGIKTFSSRLSWRMPFNFITFGALAILSAVVYQPSRRVLKALGVGQTYNRIEEYPYTCRRLHHPLLEACENMVLDSTTRALYAACATSLGRFGWSPGLVFVLPRPFRIFRELTREAGIDIIHQLET